MPSGPRATLWAAPRTSARDLGTLPGHGVSEALSISESGDVVGSSGNLQQRRAVLWAQGGAIRDLTLDPGDDRRRFEPGAGHQQRPGRRNLGDQQWRTCVSVDAGRWDAEFE